MGNAASGRNGRRPRCPGSYTSFSTHFVMRYISFQFPSPLLPRLLLLGALGLAVSSCKKDDDTPTPTTPGGGSSDKTVVITTDRISVNTTWENVEPDSTKYDYVVKTSLQVDAGVLTIKPGVRINFDNGDAGLYCRDVGAISAIGTPSQKIIFESALRAPGAWAAVSLNSNSVANVLDHCRILFAGSKEYRTLFKPGKFGVIVEGKARVRNTLVGNTEGSGFMLDWDADVTEFSGNSVRATTEYALVTGFLHLDRVAANNIFTGAGKPAINIYDGRGTADNSILVRNWGVPLEVTNDIQLYTNTSVVVEPGVTFKFDTDRSLALRDGTLTAQGTTALPITFKGLNLGAGAWAGLELLSSTPSRLDNCIVDGGGGADLYLFRRGNIHIGENAKLTISNSVVRNSAAWGINKYRNSTLTATAVTYSNNASGDVGP